MVKNKTKQKNDCNMKLLQFQCEDCEFKNYVNLKDEIGFHFLDKIRCINCGKKKSIKKRIFKICVLSYKNYPDECPTCGRINKETKLKNEQL